jgi:hypothetical protein
VLDERDQDLLDRGTLPGVAEQRGNGRLQVQRDADVIGVVVRRAVEDVDGHDERQLTPFEVVHGRKAVDEPAGVGQDHGSERPVGQVVPHEPEPVLPRGPEEVEGQPGAHRDPAEVHRHGRRGLVAHAAEVVHADALLGERFLGTQRPYLADRADQRGLAHPEPPGHEDLEGSKRVIVGPSFRGRGAHRVPP